MDDTFDQDEFRNDLHSGDRRNDDDDEDESPLGQSVHFADEGGIYGDGQSEEDDYNEDLGGETFRV